MRLSPGNNGWQLRKEGSIDAHSSHVDAAAIYERDVVDEILMELCRDPFAWPRSVHIAVVAMRVFKRTDVFFCCRF